MSDNALIAVFMGGTFYDSHDPDHPNKWWFREQPHEGYRNDATHLTSGLRYDRDWSWLMPVVEKIAKMHSEKFHYDPTQIAQGNWPPDNEYMEVIVLPLSTPIAEAYNKVVEFVKWFNTQEKGYGREKQQNDKINGV